MYERFLALCFMSNVFNSITIVEEKSLKYNRCILSVISRSFIIVLNLNSFSLNMTYEIIISQIMTTFYSEFTSIFIYLLFLTNWNLPLEVCIQSQYHGQLSMCLLLICYHLKFSLKKKTTFKWTFWIKFKENQIFWNT